jgi:hypothetical protein
MIIEPAAILTALISSPPIEKSLGSARLKVFW